MADEVLTAEELEALLATTAALSSYPAAAPRKPVPLESSPRQRSKLAPGPAQPAAGALSEDVRQALIAIHAQAAQVFANLLTPLVRRTVRAKVSSVRAVSCRDLARRLEGCPCLHRLEDAAGSGMWLLEIAPAVLYPIIDCLLGGGREGAAAADQRPPTEIDLRLGARVARLVADALAQTWRPVLTLDAAVESVPRDARPLDKQRGESRVGWIEFEVDVAGASGAIHLLVPSAALAALARQFERRSSVEAAPPTVEILACVAETTIDQDDLARLAIGDLIATDRSASEPIAVLQDGALRFYARAGVLSGRKAVEVERLVDDSTGAADAESREAE
jgi:flagellar motor switch protein FliM